MKMYQLLICCLLIIGCDRDEAIIDNFTINVEGKGAIIFDNTECEFANRDNQFQSSSIFYFPQENPRGYVLGSNYLNNSDPNSITTTFWIHLNVDYEPGQESLRPEYLKGILDSEDSSNNSDKFYPRVGMEICGKRYDNSYKGGLLTLEPTHFNENFQYEINDYEVMYDSECVDRKLLYLDITIGGTLYEEFIFANDSIFVEESNMKLLFDLDI